MPFVSSSLERLSAVRRLATAALFCLSWLVADATTASEPPYDVAIVGGRLVDGTGAPSYVADVAIDEGRIVKIGRVAADEAEQVLDATGLIVAPGFIDMMGQTATPLLDDPNACTNLLSQGITTINAGEGASAAPLSPDEGRRRGWETMAEYFQLLESRGLPLNVVQTVGHTQIRRLVLGDTDRRPSDEELAAMQAHVCEAMEAGAIGVSTALIYPPAIYAPTEEIAALCRAAGGYGGRYYTHMRNEGDLLLEAIEEALTIGREADTPVHIFHLKAAGKQNWGKMQLAIARIRAARAAGQQVTADIYPYVNNGLGIAALVHPRHFEAGREQFLGKLNDAENRTAIRQEMEQTDGWENWYRHAGRDWNNIVVGTTSAPGFDGVAGQSVAEIAIAHEMDPWDVFFQLVRYDTFALPRTMSDANKMLAMRQNFVSFCTDVGPAAAGSIAAHPRAAGSFPRLLSYYVRDLGAISLEQAVAQASAAAANNVGAYDRGRLAVGTAADVIVFDFGQLRDRATFADPTALSTGMRFVLVNGQLVWRDDAYTGARPGRVLRGPGYRSANGPSAMATGTQVPELAAFDQLMQEFLTEHRVPGAALAVTEQGRLVLARGYGYADVGARAPVQPTSLFRIASISKPITAVAIARLAEDTDLSVDDRVLDILDYDGWIAESETFDARQRDITIEHLLQHRGGWDRDKSFDPMFQSVRFAQLLNVPAPADAQTVIRAMLRQPLDFAPGERYAYSNYGYNLLGRVLEKVSGQTYEQCVQEQVLQPLGMRHTQLGRTRLEARGPQEVRYYHPTRDPSVFAEDLGEPVPAPYGGWYLEAMDAHGGWLSSAVDLARFACGLQSPDACPLLSAESWEAMHRRPAGLAGHDSEGATRDVFYSYGWMNRVLDGGRVNRWHTGSLPGTATILIRRHDGRNLIVLFNSRVSPHASHLAAALDPQLNAVTDTIAHWPAHDLFADFEPSE